MATAGDILFGELAVRKKLISKEQLDEAYSELNEMTSAGKKRDLSLVLMRNSLITVDQAEMIMEEVNKSTKCPKCGEIAKVKPGEPALTCEMCGNVIIEAPKEEPEPEEDAGVLDLLGGSAPKPKQIPDDELDFVDVSAADAGAPVGVKLDAEPEPSDVIYAEIAKAKGFLREEDLNVALQDLIAMRQRGRKRDLSTVLLRHGFITFHQAEEVLAEYNRTTVTCHNCGWVTRSEGMAPGTMTKCGSCNAEIRVEATDEPAFAAGDEKVRDTEEKEASWVVLQEPETGEKFVGQTIGGVEITKFIGSDYLGRIYAGRLYGGKRDVAVRLFSPAVYGTPQEAERLVQALHELVKLHHFNIPRIYDSDVDDSGHVYLVMDHYDGPRLYDLIVDRGPLPEDYAFGYLKSAADALSASHSAGLFHRNIAPQEMLAADDRLFLTGFGLVSDHDVSRIFDRRRPHIHAHYFSPEAVDGGPCDARSDLFSLGACMYFLLTGREPFPGHKASEVFLKIRDGKYISPEVHNPGISLSALNIIKKSLAPGPGDRYQSAQEFLKDLKRAEAGDNVQAPVFSRPEVSETAQKTDVQVSPRGAGFWIAILVSLLIFIGALFYLLRLSNEYLKDVSLGLDTDILAKREFQEAENYVRENPDDPEGSRRRLEEIIARFPKTGVVNDARKLLDTLPAPRSDRAGERRSKAMEKVNEAEKAGDIVDALLALWQARGQFVEGPDSAMTEWQAARKRLDSALQAKMNLRFVPAGEFLKGRDKETARTGAFLIDSFEVNCAEYAKFCRESGHAVPPDWQGGNFPPGKAAYPVTNITHADAEAFAAWASKALPANLAEKASRELPSREEWEKAARGKDGREFPWGNDFRTGLAIVATGKTGELSQTAKMPEGASPYGCLHMAGNVAEWTSSSVNGKSVVCGGSFRSPPRSARTWASTLVSPDSRADCIGFRCVIRLSDHR